MRTNKPYILLLLLAFTAVLSCCSSEDFADIDVSGGNVDSTTAPLIITVTDGGYASLSGSSSTRAVESNYQTSFTAGDQIGVFAVKNGKIVKEVNNLCLTAKATTTSADATSDASLTWLGASDIALTNVKGATYYAYYPYKPSLVVEHDSEVADADAFFANVISNWTPATNQSTYDDYTAQDLMIAKSTAKEGASNTLTFSMKHQMALVVIELPKIEYQLDCDPFYTWNSDVSEIKFNGFAPYRKDDGMYCYLVNPSKASSLSGSYFNDIATAEWSFATADTKRGSYKEYIVDGGSIKPITKTHTLAVGDYFMNDGSLLAGNTSELTPEQQAACIGIVYSIDANRIGEAATELLEENVGAAHGLVMALTNASDDCAWGEAIDENELDSEGPFAKNTISLSDQYNNIDGYGETQWILETHGGEFEAYSAFYYTSLYGTAENGTSQYAAPENTTGWFIPSMGQWWDILSNLGGIDELSQYQSDDRTFLRLVDAGTTAVNNMNRYLMKIKGATLFYKDNTHFWSSSEYDENWACYVSFYSSGNLHLNSKNKVNNGRVRCVFAF